MSASELLAELRRERLARAQAEAERDKARANTRKCIRLLGGIFAAVGVENVRQQGERYTLGDPDPARTLRELRERIRAAGREVTQPSLPSVWDRPTNRANPQTAATVPMELDTRPMEYFPATEPMEIR